MHTYRKALKAREDGYEVGYFEPHPNGGADFVRLMWVKAEFGGQDTARREVHYLNGGD